MALLMLGVQCEGPVAVCCCPPDDDDEDEEEEDDDEEDDDEGGDGDEDVEGVVVVGVGAPSPLVAGPRCTAGEDVCFTSGRGERNKDNEWMNK